MHIFKKMSKALKTTNENIERYKADDKIKQSEVEKLEALTIVDDYIKSLKWARRKNAVDKYNAIISFNFNYEKVADYLETSVSSVKSSVTYLSKLIEEKIGENTIDLILAGQIETAMLQFRIGTGCVDMSNIIDSNIYGMIEFGSSVGQVVSDCEMELKFLKALTYRSIQSRLNRLSKDKFALINKIMTSSDMTYAKERVLIFKYLSNEITDMDTLLSALRNIDNLSI